MAENRKWTIGEMSASLNIAYESVQDILFNELGLRRVAAKLVPKELNLKDRVDVAKDMIFTAESNPTLIKRITRVDA